MDTILLMYFKDRSGNGDDVQNSNFDFVGLPPLCGDCMMVYNTRTKFVQVTKSIIFQVEVWQQSSLSKADAPIEEHEEFRLTLKDILFRRYNQYTEEIKSRETANDKDGKKGLVSGHTFEAKYHFEPKPDYHACLYKWTKPNISKTSPEGLQLTGSPIFREKLVIVVLKQHIAKPIAVVPPSTTSSYFDLKKNEDTDSEDTSSHTNLRNIVERSGPKLSKKKSHSKENSKFDSSKKDDNPLEPVLQNDITSSEKDYVGQPSTQNVPIKLKTNNIFETFAIEVSNCSKDSTNVDNPATHNHQTNPQTQDKLKEFKNVVKTCSISIRRLENSVSMPVQSVKRKKELPSLKSKKKIKLSKCVPKTNSDHEKKNNTEKLHGISPNKSSIYDHYKDYSDDLPDIVPFKKSTHTDGKAIISKKNKTEVIPFKKTKKRKRSGKQKDVLSDKNKREKPSSLCVQTSTSSSQTAMEDDLPYIAPPKSRRKSVVKEIRDTLSRCEPHHYTDKDLCTIIEDLSTPTRVKIEPDDEGEIEETIKNLSEVTHLNENQLTFLVAKNKEYLKQIYMGKVPSERHDDYKLGGKQRRDLTYQVPLTLYSEEQGDWVMEHLLRLFCKSDMKNMDYVFRVLFPEMLIKIYMEVHGTSHEDAEKNMAEVVLAPCEDED